MEEIDNESGQRPSVSMPSLDPTDFYTTLTSGGENPAENTDSFTTTVSTDTILSSSASATVNSAAPDNLTEKLSSDTTLTSQVDEDSSAFPLIEGDTFITDHSTEESLIDSATSEHLMSQDASLDAVSESVPQPELDDSQGDDDPSIAIDQFIQKIADEQLSSKRVEERKDEETQEETEKTLKAFPGEDELSTDLKLPEKAEIEPENAPEKPSQENAVEEANMTETSVNEGGKSESKDIVEPMDVDAADQEPQNVKVTKVDGAETMESIEAIQKEIDKIPPKKDGEVAKVQNEKLSESENLESILGDKESEDVAVTLNNDIKLPTIEDSSDVAKDPTLIEKAQEEVKKLDVLVCGECHHTSYHVEEFIDHKKSKCPEPSVVSKLCESEGRPQVWGFILWKTKHVKDMGDKALNSWSLYQKWCKLPQADMNAWITAGQSIQFASKLANAKVTEVKSVKSPKLGQSANLSPQSMEFVDSNKENSNVFKANILKQGMTKPVRLNNDVTLTPSGKKEEFVVEKIMAKRFNPRKKTWEYNIKWENFGHDSNTWEPITNLSHCKKLLDQFEEQLRRMKEEKARQAQSPKGRGRPSNPKPVKPSASNYVPIAPKSIATISEVVGGVSEDYSGSFSRPQRSSKQKAMSQVKEWCGNISDDEKSGYFKRKFEADDSDEDYDEKKIKLEEDSDDSVKHSKGKTPVKKVLQSKSSLGSKSSVTIKNGGTTQQILPSNILIPDANGVVRINQKQLPSLSSGVYIMSKTAGIIKLDSTTSKVATSGGQTIVKVAPKIGQTQIKIVKKDGNTTKQIIQVAPKSSNPLAASTPIKVGVGKTSGAQKVVNKIRKEVKKSPQSDVVVKTVAKKVDTSPASPVAAQESDSDDGLEPLPFPAADEPLPDVGEDDKDEEFVLDPETGKIAGVEYVDKPVVIKEEPKPVPVVNEDLDNIVKMAAADLSDDDLNNTDNHEQEESLFTVDKEPVESKPPPPKLEPKAVESIAPTVKKIVKYTIAQQPNRSGTSNQQLNRSDSQAQLKPVQKASPAVITKSITPQVQQRRVVQQKVINHMVSQRMPAQQPRTVVRHVIEPTRPGQGGAGNINVIRKTVATTQKTRVAQRPILPSKTYSAMGGIRQTSGVGTKVQVYSPRSAISSSQTTTTASPVVRRIGNTVVRSASSQGGTPSKPAQQQQASQKPQVTRIIQRVVSASPKKTVSQPVTRVVHSQPATTPAKPRTVINMPSLTEDDVAPTPTPPKTQTKAAQQAPKPTPKPAPAVVNTTIQQETVEAQTAPAIKPAVEDSEMAEQATDWSSFTMVDSENPIYVTGDDGTIYQVAGQNEQGQTILITQGPDGQQQCLLVTNEIGEMTGEEPQPSTSAVAAAEIEPEIAVSTASDLLMQATEDLSVPVTIATAEAESIQTPLQIKTDEPTIDEIEDVDGVQDQVVAQVVRAEPPSPGGTHKVVVMLPDGSLMVTQVSPEEYASLELE